MEYEFEAGPDCQAKQYDIDGLTPPGTLSACDKQWSSQMDPPLPAVAAQPTLQPFQSAVAELASGSADGFAIKPTSSRKYTIETKGASDALLLLFEDIERCAAYVAGDDDSGEERKREHFSETLRR